MFERRLLILVVLPILILWLPAVGSALDLQSLDKELQEASQLSKNKSAEEAIARLTKILTDLTVMHKELSSRTDISPQSKPAVADDIYYWKAKTERLLSDIFYRQGDLKQAEYYFKRSLDAQALGKSPDGEKFENDYLYLSKLAEHNGNLMDAASYADTAVRLREQRLGKNNSALIDPYRSFASLLEKLGQHKSADDYLERATRIESEQQTNDKSPVN